MPVAVLRVARYAVDSLLFKLAVANEAFCPCLASVAELCGLFLGERAEGRVFSGAVAMLTLEI